LKSESPSLASSHAAPLPSSAAAPAASPPSLVHRLASILEPVDLTQLFPRAQPLEVEVGSGDGSFLVAYAQGHPERNYIGIERLLGRLRKVDRKGRRAGLVNLRLIRLEASYFLAYLLPPSVVTALHVYFPDPWPKRRHQQNRLVSARFTDLAKQVLVPGGRVYLRTDDTQYFTQINEVFRANPAFQEIETPAALAALVTDFERDFARQGLVTQRSAYQRKS
jgi:tRNA (guanine-N7-)-methyltransferase